MIGLRRLMIAGFLVVLLPGAAQAQDTDNLFPQIVNGQAGGGTYYSSKIHVLPYPTGPGSIDCTLRYWGMFVDMGSLGLIDTYNFSIQQNGGWALLQTNPAGQVLVSGYATLTCTAAVYAYVDYAFYGPSGKVGGATVFDSNERPSFRFIADQAESGARLGVAIANNTDVPRSYSVTARNAAGTIIGIGQISVPARRSLARFLDEIMGGTTGTVSHVTVESSDASNFAAIGLRFVGSSFSTLPASW